MQSAISIDQEIVDGVRALPASKRQEVLDFVDFLRQRAAPEQPELRLSMQVVARLPVRERHQYLKKYIPTMVDDFAHDPALTEFSELDFDHWAVDVAEKY